jgi:hypothetical protein
MEPLVSVATNSPHRQIGSVERRLGRIVVEPNRWIGCADLLLGRAEPWFSHAPATQI